MVAISVWGPALHSADVWGVFAEPPADSSGETGVLAMQSCHAGWLEWERLSGVLSGGIITVRQG